MNPTTEVRRLLGPLDPAAGMPRPNGVQVEHDLARILMSDPPARAGSTVRQPRVEWRWPATAAVAAVIALVAALMVGFPGSQSRSAYAATPPALRYSGQPATESARNLLLGWATTIRTASPPAQAKYQHLVFTTWSLATRIDNRAVTSAVVPATTESFKAADSSGRVTRHYEAPAFASSSDRARWHNAGSPGADTAAKTTDYRPGLFPQMFTGAAPTTVATLSPWLTTAHPTRNGPAEALIAVTDLVKEQVLAPAQRAALLQVLADLPGLTTDGAVVDRAGRSGQAFSVVSAFSGLQTRYTIIIQPSTGQLLGMEQTLTERAGALNVPVPSVIEYETYRSADYRDAP